MFFSSPYIISIYLSPSPRWAGSRAGSPVCWYVSLGVRLPHTTLFPSWSVYIYVKDDVSDILLLGVSFMVKRIESVDTAQTLKTNSCSCLRHSAKKKFFLSLWVSSILLLLENDFRALFCLKGVWHEIIGFFMNQCPPGHQVFHWGHFEFFWKFAEIFANEYLSPVSIKCSAVSLTLAKNLSTVSTTPVINPCHGEITKRPKIVRPVNDTAEKLFTDVNDTADKLFGGVLPILACLHLKLKISKNSIFRCKVH